MERTQHDVIIVGHGLAGTCLAIELERRGAKVLVFDRPMPGRASAVAAGLVNPVSLRRIVPVWRALEMLRTARGFYRSFEADVGLEIWHEMPLFKVFPSPSAAAFWEARAAEPELAELVTSVPPNGPHHSFRAPNGVGQVLGAAWLNVNALLEAHRSRTGSGRTDVPQHVAPADVVECDGRLQVHGHEANWLVWCVGVRTDLPGLVPVKGEGLTLRVPGVPADRIMQHQAFAIPIGSDRVKLGSTYAWDNVFEGPSDEGRRELIARAEALFTSEFDVEEHWWGVRPTARDRRPLLGRTEGRQAVLNGLGSRGVLLAPWCAMHLADHLLEGKALDPEVDLGRFS